MLKEKIKNDLVDTRQKHKVIYKIWDMTGGILTAKTYERVMSIVDSITLNRIFVDFVKNIHACYNKNFKDIFSFDGKVDKGSARKQSMYSESIKPLDVLNVYSDRRNLNTF